MVLHLFDLLRISLGTLAVTGLFAESAWAAGQPSAILVGAGDIASCRSNGDEATAKLLDAIPGTVFTTGDNAYESGTIEEFRNCYAPTWGRHKRRTRPAAGNHDYGTEGAAGYFEYFGAAAGDPKRGYYSYDLNAWHVIVLNSHCEAVGGCGVESPQAEWLRQDLAEHPVRCTVAYWHRPRFSSGPHGNAPGLQAFWEILYAARADVVIVGHDHLYERFGPQDANGRLDKARGIRQFTVGTGGDSHYAVKKVVPNSEVRHSGTFGVLKLTLRTSGYAWQFVPQAGKKFRDLGTASCH